MNFNKRITKVLQSMCHKKQQFYMCVAKWKKKYDGDFQKSTFFIHLRAQRKQSITSI